MPSTACSSVSSSRERCFWRPAGWTPAAAVRLEAVEFWLEAGPEPLLPQLLAALAAHGEPLRWAITAAEPIVDGAAPSSGGAGRRRLRLEAVVLCP